ncbi:MAG TPA: M23 family metallopeptidase [Gemmatimonadaceae bacterium]|nr:M23 family metallopeptidase [Gemmatimonadaceae bacterium]
MTRAHLLILLGALAGARLSAQVPASKTRKVSPPTSSSLTVAPRRPVTGSLVRLSIRRASRPGDSLATVTGEMAGEALHFYPDSTGCLRSLGAVPLEASDSVVARVTLAFASGATETLRTAIHVPHRRAAGAARARRRRLRVDRIFTAPPDTLVEARVARENELARELGKRSHETPRLWTQPFERPRSSRITSGFGAGRMFNGRLTSSHAGIDFRGRPGDPVLASNRGVVVFVGSFFLAGNVVYVDHGAGVVTGYFHLTQATVVEGDTVQRGQEIGLVGATGRVTGPHLHWSARYGALTVNPMGLVALTGGKVATSSGRRTRGRTTSSGRASLRVNPAYAGGVRGPIIKRPITGKP